MTKGPQQQQKNQANKHNQILEIYCDKNCILNLTEYPDQVSDQSICLLCLVQIRMPSLNQTYPMPVSLLILTCA